MNQQIPVINLPNPPLKDAAKSFGDHGKAIHSLMGWSGEHHRAVRRTFQGIRAQLNSQVQGVGPALASATTITPSSAIHHVTGSATISTINAPSGFSGPAWLISDAGFSLTTGGNISRAVGPFAAGQLVMVVYDPATATWYV